MARELIEAEAHPTNTFAQWYGVLAAPLAWAMQLQANYSLVPHACQTGDMKWLYVSSASFLLLALSALVIGAWDWRKARRRSPVSREDADARSSWVGLLGMLVSALFLLVIIAQAIPTLFFSPCAQ